MTRQALDGTPSRSEVFSQVISGYMRRLIILAAIIWVLFLLNNFLAFGSASAEDVSPTWESDLASHVGGIPLGITLGTHERVSRPVSSVWFLNNDVVLVTFVVRRAAFPELAPKYSTPSTSLQLHVLKLDVSSGRILSNDVWPTDSRDTRIIAVHDEKLVVQAGNKVTLISKEFRELTSVELPETSTRWIPHSSPSSQNILFVNAGLPTTLPISWIWMSAETLSVVKSWQEVLTGPVGISDHVLAMASCGAIPRCPGGIKVKDLDEAEWRTIHGTAYQAGVPSFVKEDWILLINNPMRLIRKNGERIDPTAAPIENCWWSEARVSADAKRFVVPSCHLTGFHPSADLGGADILKGLVVLDYPYNDKSNFLKIHGPPVKDWASMAVSPDGLKCAILSQTHLEMIDLPIPINALL